MIVFVVLILFLGNVRAGLIVASVIPLAMLFAFILMRHPSLRMGQKEKYEKRRQTRHPHGHGETAYYSYTQALEKVRLTGSSLQKAKESERLAMEKYKEGHLSIVEVINAQLYHLDANINYIQSKRDACFAKSGLDRALGLYAQE